MIARGVVVLRASAIGAALLAPLALTACGGDIRGLASSGELNEAILASATVDVLTAQKVPIQVMPVCTVSPTDKTSYTCAGKTTTGQPITVTAGGSATDPAMTLSVGGNQVFQGSVLTVLNNALRAKS